MKLIIALLMAGFVLMAATSAEGTIHNIDVWDTSFSPTGIVVMPGDTVRWTLQSGVHVLHSDTGSPKSWDSGLLDAPGQTFDLVFTYADGPGPFAYLCLYHPTRDTIFTADTCYASGDVNGDGSPLAVADLIYILRMLEGDMPFSVNLYEADLNGDCMIDAGDVELFNCYFIYGLSCFDPAYPVATCCYPDTVRGACCLEDSCSIRSEANCADLVGSYRGDGIFCMTDTMLCCCRGLRGNVDFDPADAVNVADVTALVNYLFAGGISRCPDESNVDGVGGVNVADVTYLVEYLFRGGNPPPSCP